MSEKDRLLRLLDEAHDRGYGSEGEEGEEEEKQRVDVIDRGASGDGIGAVGDSIGVGTSTSVQASRTELKQTADHGAQTLIPSLGMMMFAKVTVLLCISPPRNITVFTFTT